VAVFIAVHFSDDWRIRTASWFNWAVGGYNLSIDAVDVPDMVSQIETGLRDIQAAEERNASAIMAVGGQVNQDAIVKVEGIDVAGHGCGGAFRGKDGDPDDRLNVKHLEDAGNPNRIALTRLGPLWAENNQGMVLRMCSTAKGMSGQDFLVALSQTIGAKVVGWDDRYEVRPTGTEFTATPDGKVEQTANTGLSSFSAIYDQGDVWNNAEWRWYMYNPLYHVGRWSARIANWR
jgi:hypothetical protein